MKANSNHPVRSTGPLPRVIEIVTVRMLDMINGDKMVVWMTNDGKIHQQVFVDKARAAERFEELKAKEV